MTRDISREHVCQHSSYEMLVTPGRRARVWCSQCDELLYDGDLEEVFDIAR